MTDILFPLQEANEPRVGGVNAEPRVQRPNRTQLALRPVDLEALLPADHRARVVWEFVEGLELGPLYGAIKAVEGHAGRAPIDPAILMAVWLYATLEGVGSARALARGGGAAAGRRGASAARGPGVGAAAGAGSAPAEGRGEGARAGVYDGPRGAGDEDGRRGLPPGVQRAAHGHHAGTGDRRRRRDQRGGRPRPVDADGGAAAAALRPRAGGSAG